MDRQFFECELKTEGDEGVLEGYGSIFGKRDLGDDIVVAGAFSKSLASGRKVRMLWNHDPNKVIGVWESVAEDRKGLRVKGRILTSITQGREVYEMVKAGAIDGLSIGYKTIKDRIEKGVRYLDEVLLAEVSLVTFPMNEVARVDKVKAADLTERELERLLTQDAGFSRSAARDLMAGGYAALKSQRDAGAGIDDELAAMIRSANLFNP